MEKTLIIITGAAGTGKTTACHYLCDHYHLTRVVTHTTRRPREGEQDGVDYYFETPQSFATHHYLEAVDYSKAQYGSSLDGLKNAFAKTAVVCIVLDTAGAVEYLKQLNCRIVVLFMTMNQLDDQVLKQRMQKRGDSQEQIKTRLQSKDNRRDYRVPQALRSHAIVVNNDRWEQCRNKLDQVMQRVIKS